ncbi:MAG TPA: chemotaxis protein CheA, partial [Thermodesulfobacteriota bacterium]|jgi:two-component system chemotaxis sensor kinase CheA|nr:chemotaxis protein CheA [Thermodesulfobacteriota bacterium]
MPDEMEEILAEFILESRESLDRMDSLFVGLETKYDRETIDEIFRGMHTLKGAGGFLGFRAVVEVAHAAESVLKKLRDGEIRITKELTDMLLKSVDTLRLLIDHIEAKDGIEEDVSQVVSGLNDTLNRVRSGSFIEGPSETIQEVQSSGSFEKREGIQTLRVDVDRIDKVMNLTGEAVLIRNRLLNIANHFERRYSDEPLVKGLLETVSFLDLVTSDMQLAVMRMRMQPIKRVFGKFPRLVRDISGSLKKAVDLRISGEDTEVDRSVIEHIDDPLVHIMRNAIDHGIETPEERRAKGKPERGTISISAFQQGNQIVIEVSDDGRGIDIERVKRKAFQKGLIGEEELKRISDESAINLIFLPGFSTVDVSTEFSGRGVGMDVVKTSISKLNGYVEVMTERDVGTTFRMSIPLTLAIIQTLMVGVGDSKYAIPLAPVEGIIRVDSGDIKTVYGQRALIVRGRTVPLLELSEIVGISTSDAPYRYALIIAVGDRRFCLTVDRLLGMEEIVIKAIECVEAASSYTIGATITGDGRVVLILDLSSISRIAFSH